MTNELTRSPRPYPTTSITPADAYKALRAVGLDFSRETVEHPIGWSILVAVWESKRNAKAREDYDMASWARLVRSLNAVRAYDVDTKKPATRLTPTWRLGQLLVHLGGVAPSAKQVKDAAKRDADTRACATVIARMVEAARRDDDGGIVLPFEAFADVIAACRGEFVVIGQPGEEVAFKRTKLVELVKSVRPLGVSRVTLTPMGAKRGTLSLRWQNGAHRGGLDLLPAHTNACDWKNETSTAVTIPWGIERVEHVVAVQPVAVPVEPEPIVAQEEPAAEEEAAPVSEERPVAADGLSRTQRRWVQFKAIRPAVERLESDIAAGRVRSDAAVRLLAEAKACKPTSWGSVLTRWEKALAAVKEAA